LSQVSGFSSVRSGPRPSLGRRPELSSVAWLLLSDDPDRDSRIIAAVDLVNLEVLWESGTPSGKESEHGRDPSKRRHSNDTAVSPSRRAGDRDCSGGKTGARPADADLPAARCGAEAERPARLSRLRPGRDQLCLRLRRWPPTRKKSPNATLKRAPPRWPASARRVASPTARPPSRTSTSI
jgi:hypothetical protein